MELKSIEASPAFIAKQKTTKEELEEVTGFSLKEIVEKVKSKLPHADCVNMQNLKKIKKARDIKKPN